MDFFGKMQTDILENRKSFFSKNKFFFLIGKY